MTRQSIGFTQQIQLEWLEWTAQMALNNLLADEIYVELQNRLRPLVSVGGDDNRSNRGKAIGILLRIWVKGAKELRPFRDEGLALFRDSPVEDHLPIHWGMILATYPFFGTVVTAIGRLLNLQRTVTFAQVERRVQEKYGQSESIHRATQRVFYGLQDWNILIKTEERTVFTAVEPMEIGHRHISAWLIEAALLTAGAQSTPFNTVTKMPVLFPFSISEPRIAENPRLTIFRQGLDNDVIMHTPFF